MDMRDIYSWTIRGPWQEDEKTCTQWKAEEIDGVLYIAFQGSVSRLDWLQNFSFWKKPYKRMWKIWFAHAGFVKKWRAVENDILEKVKDVDKIIVTGFSQGGAVAQLCHESIRFHYPDIDCSCVAFGAPRVFSVIGLWDIRKRLDGIQLIERHHDIVCKVPPVWMLYRKAVKPVRIDKWWPLSFRFVKTHMGYRDFL